MTMYDIMYESICEQLEDGYITLEEAEVLNEAAYDRYVVETSRATKRIRDEKVYGINPLKRNKLSGIVHNERPSDDRKKMMNYRDKLNSERKNLPDHQYRTFGRTIPKGYNLTDQSPSKSAKEEGNNVKKKKRYLINVTNDFPKISTKTLEELEDFEYPDENTRERISKKFPKYSNEPSDNSKYTFDKRFLYIPGTVDRLNDKDYSAHDNRRAEILKDHDNKFVNKEPILNNSEYWYNIITVKKHEPKKEEKTEPTKEIKHKNDDKPKKKEKTELIKEIKPKKEDIPKKENKLKTVGKAIVNDYKNTLKDNGAARFIQMIKDNKKKKS